MFNKLKQFQELKNQAKTIQNMLAAEKVEIERDGIKLVINGNQEVISLTLPENIDKNQLENRLPQIFNEAIKKVQRLMAEKISANGGLSMPGF